MILYSCPLFCLRKLRKKKGGGEEIFYQNKIVILLKLVTSSSSKLTRRLYTTRFEGLKIYLFNENEEGRTMRYRVKLSKEKWEQIAAERVERD